MPTHLCRILRDSYISCAYVTEAESGVSIPNSLMSKTIYTAYELE